MQYILAIQEIVNLSTCRFYQLYFFYRYVAVCYPFQRRSMCTVKRARIVLIALAFASIVIYTFALWTSGVTPIYGRHFCATLPQFEDLLVNLVSADTILTLIVPYIAILILNARIIIAVVQIHRQRRLMNVHGGSVNGHGHRPVGYKASCSASERDPARSNGEEPQKHSRTESTKSRKQSSVPHPSQMKVTKTLVVVSTIFLLLNLPSHAIRLHIYIMGFIDPEYDPGRLYRLTQKLFLYIFYVNFAINFFLYNTCGQNFRQALYIVFRTTRFYRVCRKCWRWCTTGGSTSDVNSGDKRDNSTLLTQVTHAQTERGVIPEEPHEHVKMVEMNTS